MKEIITQKRCTNCEEIKSISCFGKQAMGKGGVRSTCKVCKKIEDSKYRKLNPNKFKDWVLRNIDKVKENRKKWLSEHLKEHSIRTKKWAKDNPEKNKEIKKKYRDSHIDERKQYNSTYRLKNKDKLNATRNNWLSRTGKGTEYNHLRRAKITGAGGVVTNDEWINLCSFYGNKCLCCGKSDVSLTQDHVIPLSIGGSNTIDNIQPLCKSCNSKKHTKHIDYR